LTYGFQQLLEPWIGSQRFEARIVSSQEGIVDVSTIDGHRESMHRLIRVASHRVTLRKKPRKDVARGRTRFHVRRHNWQRLALTLERGMGKEPRETCRDRVAFRV
jgi:hypothetical protein